MTTAEELLLTASVVEAREEIRTEIRVAETMLGKDKSSRSTEKERRWGKVHESTGFIVAECAPRGAINKVSVSVCEA